MAGARRTGDSRSLIGALERGNRCGRAAICSLGRTIPGLNVVLQLDQRRPPSPPTSLTFLISSRFCVGKVVFFGGSWSLLAGEPKWQDRRYAARDRLEEEFSPNASNPLRFSDVSRSSTTFRLVNGSALRERYEVLKNGNKRPENIDFRAAALVQQNSPRAARIVALRDRTLRAVRRESSCLIG